ncbi:ATP-dependent DNA ligase, partial [Cryobacterium sp. MLB-32]
MGKLTYDSSLTADFDDRVLAHIQLVIGTKLRRGESFYFSWRDD